MVTPKCAVGLARVLRSVHWEWLKSCIACNRAVITCWGTAGLMRQPYMQCECRWTILCQLTSWFNSYCLVRTYSNSFETLCTVVGTYYWLSCDQNQLKHVQTAPYHRRLQHPGESTKAQHRQQSQSATEHSDTAGPLKSQAADIAEARPTDEACGCQRPQHVLQSPRALSRASWAGAARGLSLSYRQKALVAAAFGVLFRPSSIMFWLPQGEHDYCCACVYDHILKCNASMMALLKDMHYTVQSTATHICMPDVFGLHAD